MRKGFIYTTDAVIALAICAITLAVATGYLQNTKTTRWGEIDLLRKSQKILFELSYEKQFQPAQIEDYLQYRMPKNMQAQITLSKYVLEDGVENLVYKKKFGKEPENDYLTLKQVTPCQKQTCIYELKVERK